MDLKDRTMEILEKLTHGETAAMLARCERALKEINQTPVAARERRLALAGMDITNAWGEAKDIIEELRNIP